MRCHAAVMMRAFLRMHLSQQGLIKACFCPHIALPCKVTPNGLQKIASKHASFLLLLRPGTVGGTPPNLTKPNPNLRKPSLGDETQDVRVPGKHLTFTKCLC